MSADDVKWLLMANLIGLCLGILLVPWRKRLMPHDTLLGFLVVLVFFWPVMVAYGAWEYWNAWREYLEK
jgi:hypothetical protein